jgi:group I intron endonuclease
MTTDPVKTLTCGINTASKLTRKEHSHPATYSLRHKVSDSIYIGSTDNLYNRVKQHKNGLIAGRHVNGNLQKAFNQDPHFDLSFVRVESKDEALEIEQKTIDSLAPTGRLLNVSTDAYVAFRGMTRSEEHKDKLRQITIQQFSTEESREKHSQISKQLWNDPDFRRRFEEGMAKRDPEETKAIASKGGNAIWQNPELKAKMVTVLDNNHRKLQKPVIVNGIEYPSLGKAAEASGICTCTLRKRLRSDSEEFSCYSYVSQQEK